VPVLLVQLHSLWRACGGALPTARWASIVRYRDHERQLQMRASGIDRQRARFEAEERWRAEVSEASARLLEPPVSGARGAPLSPGAWEPPGPGVRGPCASSRASGSMAGEGGHESEELNAALCTQVAGEPQARTPPMEVPPTRPTAGETAPSSDALGWAPLRSGSPSREAGHDRQQQRQQEKQQRQQHQQSQQQQPELVSAVVSSAWSSSLRSGVTDRKAAASAQGVAGRHAAGAALRAEHESAARVIGSPPPPYQHQHQPQQQQHRPAWHQQPAASCASSFESQGARHSPSSHSPASPTRSAAHAARPERTERGREGTTPEAFLLSAVRELVRPRQVRIRSAGLSTHAAFSLGNEWVAASGASLGRAYPVHATPSIARSHTEFARSPRGPVRNVLCEKLH
jgi:hypothetical protein